MALKSEFRETMFAHRDGQDRLKLLMNDMVIEEQLCQMRCSYCLTEDFNLLMQVPDARLRLTTDRRADWHEILDAYHRHVDSPIMRLSGGEFFWLKGSTEFVAECSEKYEVVQVITNGAFLTPHRLETLAELGNVQLCLSLDGHTLELNGHRLPPKQHKLFDVIMRHLDHAVELGIPIEIQSVLSDLNAGSQADFAEFLLERYGHGVMLYFFPVRGETRTTHAPPLGDHFAPLLERYDELAAVLPPRAFVEHIGNQLSTGVRTLRCYATATMVQLFGQGDVSCCPYAWLKPMGNIKESPELIQEQFGKHQHYDMFMQSRPRFPYCKSCTGPIDVVNLYLFGGISEEEIARCAPYAGPRALERLRELKSAFTPIFEPAGEPSAH
ncbi:radical SAM protein [Streptomyces sp. NPDC006309]|uniref:radical SAM protein n=1 Tax=Streptomyces sp. NPDC006309 TaxID=3156749 RepID=UPI0033B658DC